LVLVFLSFRIFYQESFPTSWQGNYFEIILAYGKKIPSPCTENFEGQTIPKINSYLVNGRQKAVLLKQ